MWFSPIKGQYPSLHQVDKTLPVKAGVTAIYRGTILALKSDTDTSDQASAQGVFDVASATDTLLYVALQPYADLTAGMAGTAFSPRGGVPKITGLDLTQAGEYETDVFDSDVTNYTVGAELYVASGKLTTTKAAGATLVGYVTKAPATRWVNSAPANMPSGETNPRLANRTGASVKVLQFRTK